MPCGEGGFALLSADAVEQGMCEAHCNCVQHREDCTATPPPSETGNEATQSTHGQALLIATIVLGSQIIRDERYSGTEQPTPERLASIR